jgi:hypothetical protein
MDDDAAFFEAEDDVVPEGPLPPPDLEEALGDAENVEGPMQNLEERSASNDGLRSLMTSIMRLRLLEKRHQSLRNWKLKTPVMVKFLTHRSLQLPKLRRK